MSAAVKRCPRCWAGGAVRPLQGGQTQAFTMFACASCGGVWLGSEAAGVVLTEIAESKTPQPPSLLCPCCDASMPPVWVPQAQVMIDRCAEHGVWFDHAELDAICGVAAHAKGVARPALPRVSTGGQAGAVVAAAAASAVAAYAVGDHVGGRRDSSSGVATEVLVEMPETVFFGAEAVGEAVSDVAVGAGVSIGAGVEHVGSVAASVSEGAAEAVAGATEVVSSSAEVAGDVGTGFLDAIVTVFGGLFD